MVEDIKALDFPQASGVYWFVDKTNNVIYVGSSKNLYKRMGCHRKSIRDGYSHSNRKKVQQDLYLFLQQNEFKVKYKLTLDYICLEKHLIKMYNPIFNKVHYFTDDERRIKSIEWHKRNNYKYKEKHDEYLNQLCNFNGEVLKLNALSARFRRRGIPRPTQEAKKYLI